MMDDFEKQLKNPLSATQIAELQTNKKRIAALKEAIAKAKKAGLDVAEQERIVGEQEKQNNLLLEVYAKGT